MSYAAVSSVWVLIDDYSLQVNTLSTGLLGVLLLPLLQATTKLSHPLPDMALPPHLTITGSEGAKRLLMADLCNPLCSPSHSGMFMAKFSEKWASKILEAMNDKDRCKDMLDRYFTSKLLEVFFTREIAKLPDAQGVVVKYAVPLTLTCQKSLPHFHCLFSIAAPGFCTSELTRDFELSAIAL